mmetsp:Transcript_67607/g.175134  ORF Transcript_67607/g.175134 Transcript_67607/m.175134 type:complete len:89 (+) Transcript_67607:3-269(+)
MASVGLLLLDMTQLPELVSSADQTYMAQPWQTTEGLTSDSRDISITWRLVEIITGSGMKALYKDASKVIEVLQRNSHLRTVVQVAQIT